VTALPRLRKSAGKERKLPQNNLLFSDPMFKATKRFLSTSILAASLHAPIGLSGFDSAEVYTFTQAEVVPARLVSFEFFPGDSAAGIWDFAISLEGLYLTGQGRLEGFILSDDRHGRYVSRSPDGWYSLGVVKRYVLQDLEVWVEGYPVFLSEPFEALDPGLEEDHLIVEANHEHAMLGGVRVRNLYETPLSVLDMGCSSPISSARSVVVAISNEDSSQPAAGSDESFNSPAPSEPTSEESLKKQEPQPSDLTDLSLASRQPGSGLFTPLF